MKIQDCVALVTGSNRGLGFAFCEGLLRAGARKVYAAARDPSKIRIPDSRVVAIALDVNAVADVVSAAHSCQDITLLVNNAGVLRNSPVLGLSPSQVVDCSLAGLESGIDRIFADDSAVYVDRSVRTDRATFDAQLLQHWEDSQQ
jgi:NAD(P)-dependent dehydrogenase (short-subunit alcohol dehydrogenase family)